MPSFDTNSVAREVRHALPRAVFEPATSRLWWVPLHVTLISFGYYWVLQATDGNVAPWKLLPVTLILGMSFAGLAFVAHETLHGALTRRRWLRRIVGHIGFFPFWVAPRLWIVWHNRVHHGHTNVPSRDPDAYPTLEEYNEHWPARWAVLVGAPRLGKWRGLITLLIGFSAQSLQILLFARKRGYLSKEHYRLALLETMFAFSCFVGWGLYAGWKVWLLTALVPLLIGNTIVMMHIITNHSLNRMVDRNDALASSLSVSTPSWFSFYTLGFGYHVEHHLFPSVSHRHGPLIQRELRRRAPSRYQSMPLSRALRLLFITPRVYESATMLVDPASGQRAPTLGRTSISPPDAEVVPLFSEPDQEKKQSVPPPPSAA